MDEKMITEEMPTQASDAAAVLATRIPEAKPAGVAPAQAFCPTCGSGAETGPASYVYALGRIEARYPTLSIEKEFTQATGRAETAGHTDPQAFRAVLSKRENRYLLKQLCWVFTTQGLETYILQPRDPADFDQLVESLRSEPSPLDIDVVIGRRGPIAPPTLCNGLMLPIVVFDQIYSFDRDAFISSVPLPANVPAEQFASAVKDVFDRSIQITDNAGATDEHRAMNYLGLRYPSIYATAAEAFGRNFSLTAVHARRSTLNSARTIVEVIFTYTSRQTDIVEKFFVRVDVTDEFPFLVSKISPYFDR